VHQELCRDVVIHEQVQEHVIRIAWIMQLMALRATLRPDQTV
jgi:hypothetical protein